MEGCRQNVSFHEGDMMQGWFSQMALQDVMLEVITC